MTAKIRQDFDTAMEKMQNSSNIRLQAVESQNKKETRGDKMNTPSVLTSKTTSSKDKSSEFMQNSPTPTSEATSEFQDKDTNNSSTNQNLRLQKSQTSLTPENAQEMQRIKDQAQANGSFMKAPNGKPTRLNERQWLQVRTDRFKKWFGDWEKPARIEKLRNTKPVEITGKEITPSDNIKEYKKNALEYGKTLRGKYTNKDNGEKIAVSAQGLKEVLRHDGGDIAHIQSVAAIPQIIENGIYINTAKNDDPSVNKNVKSYDYYVLGLKIGDIDYTVKAAIANDRDGTRYYDHALTQIEKIKLLDEVEGISSPARQEEVLKYKDKRLISVLQGNSSKVVDENGEPLVVYHGTGEGFTEFKNKGSYLGVKHKGFFFGDKDTASLFESNVALMPVYLNIDNPYVVDVASDIRELGDELPEDLISKWKGETWDDFETGRSAVAYFDDNIYDIYERAEEEGNNGIIVYGTDGSINIVAFSPNQIKSSDNNNGNFDENKADIRFQASKNLQNSSENDNFAKQNKNNEIPDKSPQEKLGSSNEVHSREQEVEDRLERGVRKSEKELNRQLQGHEIEDVEKQAAFDYAKENGLWIDDLYSLGEPTGLGGNENTLAIDKEI